MSEYNEIHVKNEYRSANTIPSNSVGTGGNPLSTTPPLVEHNESRAAAKKRRRNKVTARVISAFVATAGAVMLGAAVVEELDLLKPTPIEQAVFDQNNADISILADAYGMSYWVKVFDYTPQDGLSVAVLDARGGKLYEMPFESVGEPWALEGVVEDLQPATAYMLALFDGDRQLYTQAFVTETAPQPSYLLDNAEVSLSPSTDALLYAVYLPDYTVVTGVFVEVSAAGITPIRQDVDAPEDVVSTEDEITDLNANTAYTFRIYDGERLLYEAAFRTEAAPTTDIQVELSQETGALFYTVAMYNYDVQGQLLVTLTDPTGDNRTYEVYAELREEDGALIVDGSIGDLSKDTDYTFYLYDGDTLLHQEGFHSLAADSEDIQVTLTPGSQSVTYTIVLTHYDVQSDMRASVVSPAASVTGASAEQTLRLSETDDGALTANGSITALESGTDYVFYLYDGDIVVYQEEFTTE